MTDGPRDTRGRGGEERRGSDRSVEDDDAAREVTGLLTADATVVMVLLLLGATEGRGDGSLLLCESGTENEAPTDFTDPREVDGAEGEALSFSARLNCSVAIREGCSGAAGLASIAGAAAVLASFEETR